MMLRHFWQDFQHCRSVSSWLIWGKEGQYGKCTDEQGLLTGMKEGSARVTIT